MNLEIGSDRISNNFGDNWQTLDCMIGADIVHDLEVFPYPIENNTYEVIYMSHVLEHLRWTESEKILKELYRILRPGGQLEIWVPDLDKLIKGYISEDIPEVWSVFNPERHYMKWFNGLF
jgi:predicted SAM-dependent methyltransferase